MISKVVIKATKASSGVIPVYQSRIQPLLVGFGKGFISRDVFLLLPTVSLPVMLTPGKNRKLEERKS